MDIKQTIHAWQSLVFLFWGFTNKWIGKYLSWAELIDFIAIDADTVLMFVVVTASNGVQCLTASGIDAPKILRELLLTSGFRWNDECM